jgi:3-deoxy-D-manno-octulosonate 8-phosphate phosphatase (KDO 8-P phosphatase)
MNGGIIRNDSNMNVLELFKPITTFIFDVDGVLTDGSLLVMPNGLHARRMNIKDGYALQLAVKRGYRVIIISGGDSPEVKERLHKLGVHEVLMGVKNKLQTLRQLMKDNSVEKDELLFMGDDIPDAEAMEIVGLPCCPADAVIEIKEASKYISHFKGGEGCARDVLEKVLKLRGDWNNDKSIQAL